MAPINVGIEDTENVLELVLRENERLQEIDSRSAAVRGRGRLEKGSIGSRVASRS